MKQTILITGPNGMVAKQLAKLLVHDYSLRFLTRNPVKENEYKWDVKNKFIDSKAIDGVNHIIHLAGASIADKRWSSERKKEIISSRVDSAILLREELRKNNIILDSFISASAVGYYGTTKKDVVFTEDSSDGNDFLSEVCLKWEAVANSFQELNIAKQVSILRFGVVLSPNGGMLKRLVLPVKFYLGAALGSGKQYIPWIHIEDLCEMIKYVLEKNLYGVYNAVAPEFSTNKDVTHTLGKALKRPILFLNIPSFVIKIIFGEMSIVLLEGNKVSSAKIIEKAFKFKYGSLTYALSSIFK